MSAGESEEGRNEGRTVRLMVELLTPAARLTRSVVLRECARQESQPMKERGGGGERTHRLMLMSLPSIAFCSSAGRTELGIECVEVDPLASEVCEMLMSRGEGRCRAKGRAWEREARERRTTSAEGSCMVAGCSWCVCGSKLVEQQQVESRSRARGREVSESEEKEEEKRERAQAGLRGLALVCAAILASLSAVSSSLHRCEREGERRGSQPGARGEMAGSPSPAHRGHSHSFPRLSHRATPFAGLAACTSTLTAQLLVV